MSAKTKFIYKRGEFWLDFIRGAGGRSASPNLYIWWYDAATGRLKRESTRSSDVRLASDILDARYLATHRPTQADQDAYTVSECLIDYFLAHGSKQTSRDAIKARLKLISRFIDHATGAGRLADPLLPDHIDDHFLRAFRAWAKADPIVARKKDAAGNWIAGKSRQRAESTTEESVIQLKAAINYAFAARRIRYVPPIAHKSRDMVTPERFYRLSIDGLAELLDYSLNGAGKYSGHSNRLIPLRRYLIAGITILARPDALFDMSVSEDRGQWMREERRFCLNPEGRIQTKKRRPIMPVVDLLHAWLSATDEWMVCKEVLCFDENQEVNVVEQIRVASVRSAWDGAKEHLGIPAGWGPKLIRHSVSSLLANRRVNLVELELALGHRIMKKTTSKYAHLDPEYLRSVSEGIADIVVDLTKKAGLALKPPSP